VLAYRQIVALHPIYIDHAADRRRPQGRFDLRRVAGKFVLIPSTA
jgi:hypothetical protein